MSAWLLGSDTMTLIRNKLVKTLMDDKRLPEADAVAEATKQTMKWNKMNRYAILCRYGEGNNKPVKLGAFDGTDDVCSNVQMFKSLQCLHYQCSEGDTETKHRKSWKELERWTGYFAEAVASTHPDYNKAEWG
jgi:hypothetical protein